MKEEMKMPRVKKEKSEEIIAAEIPVEKEVKKSAAPKTKTKTVVNASIDVYNTAGKVVESMDLPTEIFGVRVNKALIAQAVRVYLANQRTGSASTLTRGEVTGSTRKIYRQKGTGRARHGGIRAPIFVGGGIAHGPRPKDFSLDMSKKMKKAALISALSFKRKEDKIKVMSGLESLEPKTKNVAAALLSMNKGEKKQSVLLITSNEAASVVRAARNIEKVTYMPVSQLTTYDVMKYQTILFMKDAIGAMKDRFGGNK
jgi:large subunit ribosomal protein L4